MPRPLKHVGNALISISLHLYSKPICCVIAHELSPPCVCVWARVCGHVFTPLPESHFSV